ncbi:MAG TPA: cytochrome c oxidase accessory protein CcoG [Pseudomonadales bacterium]|nr:cytochrome c oxidase accessory protein CcoG [Pseudomonadales bacterium]
MSGERIPVTDLAPVEVGELDLYQKRERIYTRKVEGFFQRLRLYTGWPLLIMYFGGPWLQWDGRQAIWFDLPTRKFHIFAITFWPQDAPLLAWLLVIAAFALFTVTVFAGRVWCGYTCPQTVWTSIFMWAEQFSEGTRNQRIRLDQAPWSLDKLRRKLQKHALWFGISLFTGIAFVGYFTPIRDLVVELPLAQAHMWAYLWVMFFTLATYINAGWLREQVCMYMCPYARFQAVMFDPDTLIVSYDAARGEPRGSRRRNSDPRAAGLGDCIDCELCVQVCPTGIDIRNGLQYECITCALCIDACDSVMDRMNYPRGLIRYTTENALEGRPAHVLRPRLLGYSTAVLAMTGVFLTVLLTRVPVGMDVIRERGQLFREVGSGMIENVYTLKIRNMSESTQSYRIGVEGLADAAIEGRTEISLASGEVFALPVAVRAPRERLGGNRSVPIVFTVDANNDAPASARADSRFLGPGPVR